MTKIIPAVGLHLTIQGKISASEVATTLTAFEREYSRFMVDYALKNYGVRLPDEALNLYVSECRIESIFAIFEPAVDMLFKKIEKIELVKATTNFFNSTAEAITRLSKLAETASHSHFEMSKARTETFKDILLEAPRLAGDGLILTNLEMSDTGLLGRKITRKATFTPNEAQLALKGAREHIDWINDRHIKKQENVTMYLEQATKGKPRNSGRTPDRAMIPQLSKEALPIYFPSETDGLRIKQSIISGSENPFVVGFRIDVGIEFDQFGNPKSYTVFHVHEVIRQNDPSPGLPD